MRPARAGRVAGLDRARASPPPSRSGPAARETALASSTASQPSSIASAASEAVPIPASRITGTAARSTMIAMLYGLRMPGAGADRRAERHHRGAAGLLEPAGEDRVVVGVGQDREAVGDQRLGGVEQLDRVGQQRAVVADHLELDPVGLERLAGELRGADGVARGVAAGRVGQARRGRAGRSRRATEPCAVGSTRRSATVTISAPEARSAASICSSERKPPVPTISREPSSRPPELPVVARAQPPWIAAQHLDPSARRASGVVVPLAARHDLAVERDRDAAAPALGAGSRDARRRRVAPSAELAPARRSARSSSQPTRRSATASRPAEPRQRGRRSRSAVSGASRMPLRKWPVARTRPSSAPGPISGRLSGRAGPQPGDRLDQLQLGDVGEQRGRPRAAARGRRRR